MKGPPYTPVFADAQVVAQARRDRLVALLNVDTPKVPDQQITTYHVADADASLIARGFLLRSVVDGPVGISVMDPFTPVWTPAPFGSLSFTPHVARTYQLETHLTMLTTIQPGLVQIGLVVNAIRIEDPEARWFFNTGDLDSIRSIHFTLPVALPAAPVTISWQWIGDPNMILEANTACMRAFRVIA